MVASPERLNLRPSSIEHFYQLIEHFYRGAQTGSAPLVPKSGIGIGAFSLVLESSPPTAAFRLSYESSASRGCSCGGAVN